MERVVYVGQRDEIWEYPDEEVTMGCWLVM